MRKKFLLTMILSSLIFYKSGYAQVKWAQTGFNFLSISSDARAGGMGLAVASVSANRSALFHNPATMSDIQNFMSFSLSTNSWIADIKHLSLSLILRPFSGNYGVIGLSLQSVDYGEFKGTMRYDNTDGYIDTEIFEPSALAIGIGYAKPITDWFGVGGQIKFCYQYLGKAIVPEGNAYATKSNVADVIAFDFGTHFKTGIKSLAFGMCVRNFSREVKYEVEGFQLPLLFTFGISANVLDFFNVVKDHKLLVAVDATHPRSHPEQLLLGAEYTIFETLSLRIGYVTNNSEDNITYGIGLSSSMLSSKYGVVSGDYSYTPFGRFGNVQRLTLRIDM